ncbi:MAG: ribonuclease H family protein [Eubacterium sp.]|nr:ribonuclease H family protein [Eubacterium sp.]
MAAKKYYAVREGRVPGIYNTWDECKANVTGFSGAVYKSFTTIEEAKAFMGQGKPKQTQESEAVAYVDGSYNIATKEYSYGMLMYVNGDTYEAAESFDDPEMSQMRNVAGEIEGSMHAMKYCLENGIKSLDIYYDYAGIEKWALGEWKTNKEGTIAYKNYYDSIKDKLEVHFHKVKGHSGDAGNDRADALAKSALGIS